MGAESASFGILASGAYVPRWRIAQATIADAIGWTRGRSRAGKGTRSFGNWDEDSLTLATEAARAALAGAADAPAMLHLASTSLPFADRSNAGVLREALALPPATELADLGGSRRAGTSALLAALERRSAGLVCASDCVDTRPGSEGEPETGHGAAALRVGRGEPIAVLVGAARLHEDLVDRYREAGERFDYRLEARWFRDAGTRRQLGGLVGRVLADAGLAAGDVDAFLAPFPTAVTRTLCRDAGLEAAETHAGVVASVGLCGAAQPLLMLHQALAVAERGRHLLLVGAGQGFDVLLLRTTEAIAERRPAPVGADAREECNYTRYLGLRRLLDIDGGLRSERDNRTAQSVAYRHHETLNGFLGGLCSACGKLQFPPTERCVHCHAEGTQTVERMADLAGRVNSFTEDWLAWSPRPPLIFGNVHFPGGANVMMEFTDFEAGELEVGMPVRMALRVKDYDTRRGFRRYFWKPAPIAGTAGGAAGDG